MPLDQLPSCMKQSLMCIVISGRIQKVDKILIDVKKMRYDSKQISVATVKYFGNISTTSDPTLMQTHTWPHTFRQWPSPCIEISWWCIPSNTTASVNQWLVHWSYDNRTSVSTWTDDRQGKTVCCEPGSTPWRGLQTVTNNIIYSWESDLPDCEFGELTTSLSSRLLNWNAIRNECKRHTFALAFWQRQSISVIARQAFLTTWSSSVEDTLDTFTSRSIVTQQQY